MSTKVPKFAKNHPINNIVWEDVNALKANSYNPNVVMTPEMKLLKHSLMMQGWIQPILVCRDLKTGDYEVIDGFHRFTLCKTDPDINAMTEGLVPVVIMDLSKSERMMLTIRINRAKGNHMAIKMHEIVYELHHDHGCSIEQISKGIGADKHEVETLLMENVFEKKNVANVPYSKAWVPAKGRGGKKS